MARKMPSGQSYKEDPLLIDLDAVAKLLSISRRTAVRMLADGALPGVVRLRRRVLINRRKLEAWIARGCPDLAPAPND